MTFVGFKTLINLDNVEKIILKKWVTVGQVDNNEVRGECHVIVFIDGKTELVFADTDFYTDHGSLEQQFEDYFLDLDVVECDGKEYPCFFDYDLFMILSSLSKEYIENEKI